MERRIYLAPGVAGYGYSCMQCMRDAGGHAVINESDLTSAWVHGWVPADVDEATAQCGRGHVVRLLRVAPGVDRFPVDPDVEPRFCLDAADGSLFALRALSYEFPAGSDSANWLTVEIEAAFDGRSWRTSDSALETWDFPWLADWLDGVAAGEEVDTEVSFTEPNLVFELTQRAEDGASVRVCVEGELRPAWANYTTWDERELCAGFDLSRDELRAAARALRAEAVRFPPRPEPSDLLA